MTDKDKFTPEPWEMQNRGDAVYPRVFIGPLLPYGDGSGAARASICINEGASRKDIEEGEGIGTTHETCLANAALIAAAPALLRELRGLRNVVVEFPHVFKGEYGRKIIERVDGVLRKAVTPTEVAPEAEWFRR